MNETLSGLERDILTLDEHHEVDARESKPDLLTPVKQAIALTERISPPDLNALLANSREIESAQAEINHVNGLINDLLGVEAAAKRKLQSRLDDVQLRYKTFVEKGKQLQRLEKVASVYPRLSLEPLTWRDKNEYPRLVVFALTSSICRFVADYDGGKLLPDLPRNIVKQYVDVLEVLRKKRREIGRHLGKVELVCEFEGMIPREVRGMIKEARELFGDQIFIVAEPGSYTLNRDPDPLVVGYDPIADPDALWLIADFDTTPVEEMMIFHFDK